MILTEEAYEKAIKQLDEITLFAANADTPAQKARYLKYCGDTALSIKQTLRKGLSVGGDNGGNAA
jgi:hypothetical protein